MIAKKMKKFLSLPSHKKKLYFEAFLYLAMARLLKALPFARVTKLLNFQSNETTFEVYQNPTNVKEVSRAIATMSRHTLWESACLVQAIAAMKMLERRKIESTLYLGTARDDRNKMIAHAWLRCGSMYVTGGRVRQKFTVVGVFSKPVNPKEKENRNGTEYNT
ncbi:lasso peptide biosynthesis B2 protein [Aquibacillus albus]|uniref:Microcin J25-processing protein McjB C-terminal domain-containing protein n=1 Tax=Aquibacillus albus TaxID=1168171 RepID=A0ABS2N5V9_9BACI|nr:lasso peptide biosynthesis B2 protein [Aquibacillus albus]MBM7573498.1 hypothetical protein [Aquibacillus albus]